MLKEFRDFAVKGNVIDLAVGIIIGAAFGKIVSSLVNDIIMPAISPMLGKLDFSNLYIALGETAAGAPLAEVKAAGVPVIAYGQFINVAIEFVIVAFAVFMLVKAVNTAKRKEAEAPAAPAEPPAPPAEEVLLTEIRDLLKAQAK
ncbi:large conductance mechanosensitive channel protein MscL [Gimibacter soli]|uniref:Large-conductance mechanosensitive channel n=1 Tax=Gimibacter soli TaxID=3024400 RepID=A0AAE9XPJ2_9PROT|nr:large conductance mechanosensitive channel protein MscL [Gimibacter soli]WCL52686.1 large conductance mechanosensitive channel protein MscL [Gimibacter soli]